VMLFSGLCIGLFLGGCGDNPCDDGDPDTCANIPNTAPHACLVIQEEDFACLCCTPEASPCANPKEEYQWNELTHTCDRSRKSDRDGGPEPRTLVQSPSWGRLIRGGCTLIA
jgi:hypothetical protein